MDFILFISLSFETRKTHQTKLAIAIDNLNIYVTLNIFIIS